MSPLAQDLAVSGIEKYFLELLNKCAELFNPVCVRVLSENRNHSSILGSNKINSEHWWEKAWTITFQQTRKRRIAAEPLLRTRVRGGLKRAVLRGQRSPWELVLMIDQYRRTRSRESLRPMKYWCVCIPPTQAQHTKDRTLTYSSTNFDLKKQTAHHSGVQMCAVLWTAPRPASILSLTHTIQKTFPICKEGPWEPWNTDILFHTFSHGVKSPN